ncbi:kinesin-like protein KIF20B isoform X2 [Rhineura floridana]|uniref:kinesin-like protein KIF20B isoform X2 n=1 Tax=Rhineura floridana TaxID=261503 RepID=UPI002AC7EFAB|nr:kinesin-like protein KIF20B isoform X2 [Rhineura floridana]
MEANLDKPAMPRPSFLSAVELSPRTCPVDASDIKKNLYGDFSSVCDINQRESLESRERIRVCLRIKPLMQWEQESDSEVFGSGTTQEELFEGTVKQPVLDFLKGHSRLIFTYGVTNAGKTYTYQGTDEDGGILPRALDMLFKRIQGKLYPEMDLKPHRCREHRRLTKQEMREETSVKNSLLRLMKEVDYPSGINRNHIRTADHSEEPEEPVKEAEHSKMEEERGAKFSVWVSFCEIYNECVYDLLLPISNEKRRKVLRLAQDVKGCLYVKDLQWIQVSNFKEAFKLMKLGLKHQSFASTKLNANSSRSHSIFTVKMLKIDSEATRVIQVNELFLCDLAGSERCTRTRNEGERLKESGNINTSLLILGKCINALKMSQQSKLQHHIPFRESKLTHFFQGFFSGKGKVCMIVNVSQNTSAYDETLNVLKFSAIAQKVMVLDSTNSPPQESFEQISVKAESEDDVCLSIKRATLLWERTLEDVMEDEEEEEELVEDDNGMYEVNCVTESRHVTEAEPDVTEEATSQMSDEDSNIVIGKEEYQRLLDIIEDLKNKLIGEKKGKLLMELRIREEVTQECVRYLAEKESNLKKFVDWKQEMMEDNCEERMKIYKDLMKECIPLTNGRGGDEETQEAQSNEQLGMPGGEAREPSNATDLSCMVESLQENVADIKQQAEIAYGILDALEEPQTTIKQLEKQLAEVTAALSETQAKLLCRSEEVTIRENKLSESAKVLQDATEKMALQNQRIQELSQVVEQKDDEIRRLQVLISQLEAIIRESENTITSIKQEMEQENPIKASCFHSSEPMERNVGGGRKRCLESAEEVEGPPAKQGSVTNHSKDAIEAKSPQEMQPPTLKEKGEMVVLRETNQMLEMQLAALREELGKEKNENEGFSRKMTSLCQELSSSEEKASALSRELYQQQANCGKIMSELVMLRDKNKDQEEKLQVLLQEIETASQNIAEKKSTIKAVEVKIGELNKISLQYPAVDVDLANRIEMTELPKEKPEQTQVNLGRNSSFHHSIENIWEVSKQIVHASSQKSTQIEDLLQQVEQLRRNSLEAEDEISLLKLKLSEMASQRDASLQENKCLLNQLRDLQHENACYAEKYQEEENRTLGYFEKIKKNDGLLEECRLKEASIACLERTLTEKESAILAMEREVKDMREKLSLSESKIQRLNDHESQLKAQVLELKNKVRTFELQEKDKEESKQAVERLKKELSESTALSSRLQIEIQRKDDEFADLKEKLADAKKQIEQVQRQVGGMRAEEKLLRNKVSELEKAKNQLTEELDLKQRTIQEFKKEELNKKLEDTLQQYQRACKDVCSKEKIIEDMKLTLEEQEQTQSQQDRLLEANLEENEKLMADKEEWVKKYHELEKQMKNLEQRNVNVECEKSTELLHEELKKLEEKLKECEEQHKADRKKWLAEKMTLITQAKEAETHRNRDMKRYAGDREYHAKQLAEAEKLVTEKDNDLQKWRTERDQLVAALEVQLSSLVSSNAQKDKEIEELKKCVLKTSGKDCRTTTEEVGDDSTKVLRQSNCENFMTVSPILNGAEESKMDNLSNCKECKEKQLDLPNCSNAEEKDLLQQSSSRASLEENIQDQSDTILDSCEVSSEGDQTSRFPKPEMEIQFTPLQPNKMEVKHQGSPSAVTIKVSKARKRKSNAMDEDFLKSENEKNATSPANNWSDALIQEKKKTVADSSHRKDYSLRSKHLAQSIKSSGNGGGTLQKVGYFFQSSPTILQSKAKKLIETIKSPKSNEQESVNYVKPKRAKRKLYSTDISSPMEFSGHVIVMDQKESDHEIIKRRLRTKKTH